MHQPVPRGLLYFSVSSWGFAPRSVRSETALRLLHRAGFYQQMPQHSMNISLKIYNFRTKIAMVLMLELNVMFDRFDISISE